MNLLPHTPEFEDIKPVSEGRRYEFLQSSFDIEHIPELIQMRTQLYLVSDHEPQHQDAKPVAHVVSEAPKAENRIVSFPKQNEAVSASETPAKDNDLDQKAINAELEEVYRQQEAA